jgi:hypothetical protein
LGPGQSSPRSLVKERSTSAISRSTPSRSTLLVVVWWCWDPN